MEPIRAYYTSRIRNSANPHQGKAKRVLCVCSAGLLRSPTAANVLHRMFGYNTRSVGIEPTYALVPVDEVLLCWADEIVTMTADQARRIQAQWPDLALPSIKVLNIDDAYGFMDPTLVRLIEDRYMDAV